MMLTLAHEMVLLGLSSNSNRRVHRYPHYAAAAGALSELAMRQMITQEHRKVIRIGSEITGEPVLDDVLTKVRSPSGGHDQGAVRPGWVLISQLGRQVYGHVLDELTGAGAVERDRRRPRIFGARYRLGDPSTVRSLVGVARVAFRYPAGADEHDLRLAALCCAFGAGSFLGTELPRRQRSRLGKQLVDADWVALAAQHAVASTVTAS